MLQDCIQYVWLTARLIPNIYQIKTSYNITTAVFLNADHSVWFLLGLAFHVPECVN